MEIKGKAHCMFEQSGTFKQEFIRLGIEALDYDIQNNFGQTDCVVDLFAEIDKAYAGEGSLFDSISKKDLIVAFYPCIYFCGISQMNITLANYMQKFKTLEGADKYIFERLRKRDEFYYRLCRLIFVCLDKGLRLIIENPWTTNTYLKGNFIAPPAIVDENRRRRGDYFEKPTAYWFFNCTPTHGSTYQEPKELRYFVLHSGQHIPGTKVAKGAKKTGLCSEDRSMIAPDYARNFICDFIPGRHQPEIDPQLFIL